MVSSIVSLEIQLSCRCSDGLPLLVLFLSVSMFVLGLIVLFVCGRVFVCVCGRVSKKLFFTVAVFECNDLDLLPAGRSLKMLSWMMLEALP